MDHNLLAMDRENDRQAAEEFDRELFIGRESSDLALRLTDGRATTTLVDPCNGYGYRNHRITLADEFIAWARQIDGGDGAELIAGVLFRRQGALDPVVRHFATDYASWLADQRTDLGDDEVMYQRGGV